MSTPSSESGREAGLEREVSPQASARAGQRMTGGGDLAAPVTPHPCLSPDATAAPDQPHDRRSCAAAGAGSAPHRIAHGRAVLCWHQIHRISDGARTRTESCMTSPGATVRARRGRLGERSAARIAARCASSGGGRAPESPSTGAGVARRAGSCTRPPTLVRPVTAAARETRSRLAPGRARGGDGAPRPQGGGAAPRAET